MMINSTQRAKGLRKSQTDAESLLWQYLRNRQIVDAKFRRQYVMGKYIVDFVCLECGLIVEIDGGRHADRVDYDERHTAYLEQEDFRVMCFWNNEVLRETEAVLEVIKNALIDNNPSSHPSPLAGDRE